MSNYTNGGSVYAHMPASPTSPNAFAGFQQSPRDAHAMYTSMGAVFASSGGNQSSRSKNSSAGGVLKKLASRK
ncbi:hypothetical protein PUNSTDRAFT_49185 [Punctularia strigosozonata HHB-11173 SS5]|uniref:uncharacterized protein n=1 Tax=Punctularia strigosozonata (strain HHB-11173) TaxID=741275 RepID=UPI0004417BC7|nr:uncharacterized protein PUNSTDRAFT_49185 [Punctularia strigosozonata HHB-11173 SS5]EIN14372.1 hypothetical protein PUNSTDRAFT_49185 [Punctularia strigosozonata HHB-11173 SS5]